MKSLCHIEIKGHVGFGEHVGFSKNVDMAALGNLVVMWDLAVTNGGHLNLSALFHFAVIKMTAI